MINLFAVLAYCYHRYYYHSTVFFNIYNKVSLFRVRDHIFHC